MVVLLAGLAATPASLGAEQSLAEQIRASWERDHAKAQNWATTPPAPLVITYRVTLRPQMTTAEFNALQAEVLRQPHHPRKHVLDREVELRRVGIFVSTVQFAFDRNDRFRTSSTASKDQRAINLDVVQNGDVAWVRNGTDLNLHRRGLHFFPPEPDRPSENFDVQSLVFPRFAWSFPTIRDVRVERDGPIVQILVGFLPGYSARSEGRWDIDTQTFLPERTQFFEHDAPTLLETYAPWRFDALVDGFVTDSVTRTPSSPFGDVSLVSIEPIAPDLMARLVADPADGGSDPWRGTIQLSSITDYRFERPRLLDGAGQPRSIPQQAAITVQSTRPTVWWWIAGLSVLTVAVWKTKSWIAYRRSS